MVKNGQNNKSQETAKLLAHSVNEASDFLIDRIYNNIVIRKWKISVYYQGKQIPANDPNEWYILEILVT